MRLVSLAVVPAYDYEDDEGTTYTVQPVLYAIDEDGALWRRWLRPDGPGKWQRAKLPGTVPMAPPANLPKVTE